MVKQITILFLILSLNVLGNKYCVYFTDKNGVDFSASKYFNTPQNRMPDTTDFPVNQNYIQQVKNITGNISSVSRWLNAVVVKCNREEIEKLNLLNFVKGVEPLMSTVKLAKYKFKATLQTESFDILSSQVSSMQGELFEQHNIDGKGIRIAIFDAGFTGVDKSPVFEHLRTNNQIVKTYDFVKNNENVYGYNQHGTMVLSCIAGLYNNEKLGMATGAEFLLARTESNMETLHEEEYWLQAVEWAYRNGADIINSSLGYTYHRYFENDMDGETSLVAKAAKIAGEKGMLVVNAMGNDGNSSWQYMCTPADVENVLAVGGIDPGTGIHIPFSSFGPTADKRMKPNVSAYAHVITGSNNKITEAYGTSFSSPLVAGFAACVLQMHPEYNFDKLFDEIEKSGSLYPYFDYAHGYGIPQAGHFLDNKKVFSDNINIEEIDKEIRISIDSSKGIIYYHIETLKGQLEKYSVVQITQDNPLILAKSDLTGKILRIHFDGTTLEKIF